MNVSCRSSPTTIASVTNFTAIEIHVRKLGNDRDDFAVLAH